MNPPPTQKTREWLQWILFKTTPMQLDRMVDRVALETEASLKSNTPKKWTGEVRNGWTTRKPELGVRIIGNDVRASNGVPIMLYLEDGTANNGAGFIYPKNAKKLYVPLTKRAAAGWRAGLKYGRDYILKLKVRGARGQHIVANERPRIAARMKEGIKRVVAEVLKREGVHAKV